MADETPPNVVEKTEEELEAEENERRERDAAWKKTTKQLKGKDMNSLLAAINACRSHDYLLSGGCLVPLVDTLKKPSAKWAKKNYPAVISSALETLLSFLLVEPVIPEPPPVEEPPPVAEGVEPVKPTPPPPQPPPRHPNMAFILTEMAKKKKQCKIKGVEKIGLNMANKDVSIQLNSLRCVKAVIDGALAIDDKTKIPKGKKSVLLDLPLAKEKKGIIKKVRCLDDQGPRTNHPRPSSSPPLSHTLTDPCSPSPQLATGTVKNLSKLLLILVNRFEKEKETPPELVEPEEGAIVPPLPTTNEAIAVALKCIEFCIEKNGATSMKNMIKNKCPEALLRLLALPDHRPSALGLLTKLSGYGEAGAKSMAFSR